MYSSKKTLYPSLNEMLAQARSAELSAAAKPSGRTRGSLRIKLDVRRGGRKGFPG